MTREKKGTTSHHGPTMTPGDREPCGRNARRETRGESEAKATMPVVATLKEVTIGIDYILITFIFKLKREWNINYRDTTLVRNCISKYVNYVPSL